MIYRAIRQDGDQALGETSASLGWSGLAAGLSMGFSLAGEGLLKAYLPEAVWTPLVSKFGYALAFLMVILGRQQLFTEQTLTAMLPLFSARRAPGIGANVARLWIIVLVANLAGAAAFAAAAAWTPAFSTEVQAAFLHIGQDARAAVGCHLHPGYLRRLPHRDDGLVTSGSRPIPALDRRILAYIVGVAGLAHVIAGTADCLFVVFKGEATLSAYVGGFLVPSPLGSSIGGVALVASLAHGQHAPER